MERVSCSTDLQVLQRGDWLADLLVCRLGWVSVYYNNMANLSSVLESESDKASKLAGRLPILGIVGGLMHSCNIDFNNQMKKYVTRKF